MLLDNLATILPADPLSKAKIFRKGEIVQRANEVNISAIYVVKGLLRSYVIDSKGKEHIYMFAPEGWIVGDMEAMEYDQPMQLYIDCIEDSEIILFDKDSLINADFTKKQMAENAQLLRRRIGRLQRRVLMLMGAPAIDRYQYFIKTYPDLPNRVPQHMIASFLGIAPQTLSTLRRKIAQQK